MKLIILFIITILVLIMIIDKVSFNKNNKIQNQKLGYSYRLGDIVKGYIYTYEKKLFNKYTTLYPDTIASKYIIKGKELNIDFTKINYNLIMDIIDSYKLKFNNNNTINIHLRVGDTITGYKNKKYIILKNKANKLYALQPIEYINIINILKKKYVKFNKIKLFYGFHTPEKDSDILKYSYKYINEITTLFTNNNYTVIKTNNNHPDLDFIEMTNSKIFIQSGGGYSKLISDIVKIKNNIVINPFEQL